VKKHIPNLLTLLNLACGTLAIVLSLEGQWQGAIYLMLAACLFDFLDGLAARLLKAYSETGKQLDSLADMVSFGVLPATFIYGIFGGMTLPGNFPPGLERFMLLSILLVPAFSAIRLARFNLEESKTDFFAGLPTPAHALFWAGLYWQFMEHATFYGQELNPWFLWAIMMVMAMHMIVPVPMYTLKFEHFRIRENLVRYLLLVMAVFILVFTGIPGLSLVILCYILLSLLNFLLQLRVSR
jgi:CDP-diacylglycerol--serine O-phosphatidyltransferase